MMVVGRGLRAGKSQPHSKEVVVVKVCGRWGREGGREKEREELGN